MRRSARERAQHGMRMAPPRRGMALLAVMVVILLVALAAYSFNQRMADAYRSVAAETERAQARLAAHSGIEVLLQQAARPRTARGLDANEASLLQGPVALEDDGGRGRGFAPDTNASEEEPPWRFCVLAPANRAASTGGSGGAVTASRGGQERPWRWGVVNESSKLNFTMLRRWEAAFPGQARRALSQLPAADEELVSGIIAAFDLAAANPEVGRMETIRKQLQARGGSGQSADEAVRSWAHRWTGGDWNHDYRLDAVEAALATSSPEFETGLSAPLDPGSSPRDTATIPVAWRDYLTFTSGQRNERADGRPRVFLNMADLSVLRRELLAIWPQDWVHFVIAARQYGLAPSASASGASGGLRQWSPDFSVAAAHPIRNPLDLIDAAVRVPEQARGSVSSNRAGGENAEIVLASPFSSAPAALRDYLARLLDDVTVNANDVLVGQVDVLTAPVEVLRGVPQISAETAEQIVDKRNGQPSTTSDRQTLAWLVHEDIVSLSSLRPLLPWLTVGGDCYSCQVIGWRDRRSATYRCTVVLDGRTRPATRQQLQQWHAWGRGFSAAELMPAANRSTEDDL